MVRLPCCDKNVLRKGPWTVEEDQKLMDYVQKNGQGSWRTLPKNAGLSRSGKSCRFRWINYLRPDIKRGRFTFEEEETIIQLHSILGNKWSAIAARLPGRTDNEIKNYWNTHIRKRLLRMGIHPVTHSPRLDFLDLSSLIYNPNQLDVSGLLGMNPLINSELMRLATNLLSPPQCLKEQPFPINTQTVQNTLQSLQDNQLQNSIQEIQEDCTTSYGQRISEAQMMQLQIESGNLLNPADMCYQNLDHVFAENHNFVDPTCCTEDKRERFCSDLSQFEIPGLLDVNDYL